MSWESRRKKLRAAGWIYYREGQAFPIWCSPCGSAEFTDDLKEMSEEEFNDTLEINMTEPEGERE
ncbi:MAG: hypothetical protein ABFC57_06230 [Veillonellales bacterium]